MTSPTPRKWIHILIPTLLCVAWLYWWEIILRR